MGERGVLAVLARLLTEWRRLRPFFSLLDFAKTPSSRVGWYVRTAITAFGIVVCARRLHSLTEPLLDAKPPPILPAEEIEDYRFRMPERTRREIFMELGATELGERRRAADQNTWQGHLWSREDDRGHVERMTARAVAAHHKISLSQVYLILDEGIRNHWPADDEGDTLPATTPPLNPRQTW